MRGGSIYTRFFVVNNIVIQSQVIQVNDSLEVTIKSPHPLKDSSSVIAGNLKKMLGLETNIEKFYVLSNKDSHLRQLAKSVIGVKPPRFPTVFEALINAIACQQITLDVRPAHVFCICLSIQQL